MGDNNEENILKAFTLGAQEVMAQKREPQDVILLGEPSKQHNNQMLIGVNDEDSDDDFAGSVPLYQNVAQKKASYLDEKAEIMKEKDAVEKKEDLENNNRNTNVDDQMFLKKEDLEENGNPSAFAKPAGIYLEKDEELEKMKAIYEGQAGGLTMAQQQTQIAKKKKQQQQQQQLQKEKEKENQTKVAKLKKTDFKYDKSKVVKNLINDEEELGEIGEWIEATANKAKKGKNEKDLDGEDADSEEEQQNEADDDDFNYDEEDIQKHKEQQKKQLHKENDDFIEEEEDDPENQEANIPLSSSQQQRQKNEQLALTKQKQEIANKKLQQQSILNHRGGPIANRLQDKAKFIELTHNTNNNTETKNSNLESNNQNQKINENSKNTQNSQGTSNPFKEDNKNSNQWQAQMNSNITKTNNVLQVGINQVDEPAGSKPAVSDNDEDEQYWKAINAKTKSEQQKMSLHIDPKNDSANKREISFIESWQELKIRNLSDFKKGIQVDSLENQSIIDKLFGMCGLSHSNLSSVSLMDERDQLFAIAKMPFTDADPLHFKMLSSIFFALKENYNCGRTGSHWETIGFQGVNPASDLRGVGMLGVLQMLALTSQHLPFARYALKYSTHQTYQFPLAATLLNITNIVLNTAREQKLNGLINQEKSVISVFNNFFFATFYFFFIEYQKSQMTFNLVGNHLKNVEASVKLSPKKTLDDFKASIQLFYKQHDSA